jgi:hypothetical protein
MRIRMCDSSKESKYFILNINKYKVKMN